MVARHKYSPKLNGSNSDYAHRIPKSVIFDFIAILSRCDAIPLPVKLMKAAMFKPHQAADDLNGLTLLSQPVLRLLQTALREIFPESLAGLLPKLLDELRARHEDRLCDDIDGE